MQRDEQMKKALQKQRIEARTANYPRPERPAMEARPRPKARPNQRSQSRPGAQRRPLPSKLLQKAKQHLLLSLMLLLGLVFLFQFLYLVLPKKSESQVERRALSKFPKLSAQAFFDGSWHQQVETYLNDHLPLRDLLISLDRSSKRALELRFGGSKEEQIEIIHGQREVQDQGNQLPRPDAKDSPEQEQEAKETSPRLEVQTEENTPKKTPAEPSLKAHAKPNLEHTEGEIAYESYSVIIKGVQGMEIFNYSPELWSIYAGRLNYLRQIVPENVRVFSLIAPTAVAFYGPETYRQGPYSTWDAIQQCYSELNPKIYTCDAYGFLSQHSSEYIYFRTDHHWTGLGAYYAYQSFCEAAGFEATALDKMQKSTSHTFLGTLYASSEQNQTLAANPDYCEYYHPLNSGTSTVASDESFSDGWEGALLNPAPFPDYPYLGYSGGDAAVIRLKVNQKEPKNARVAILKDSYGNALAPYLMDHYDEVYIIDPRVYEGNLLKFIESMKIDDLLVVNYSFACSNPLWAAGFDLITGYQPE